MQVKGYIQVEGVKLTEEAIGMLALIQEKDGMEEYCRMISFVVDFILEILRKDMDEHFLMERKDDGINSLIKLQFLKKLLKSLESPVKE